VRGLPPQTPVVHDATVTLRVVDDPPDRPEWLRETIRLLVDATTVERERLLGRVAAAPEEDLVQGSDDDWGLGQVATHLLIVERGVALIGLRLGQGAPAGQTGQPRPAASAVSRAGIGTWPRRPPRPARGSSPSSHPSLTSKPRRGILITAI